MPYVNFVDDITFKSLVGELLKLGKEAKSKAINEFDRNTIQIDGFTENVLPLESIADKMKAFNFNVLP